MKTVSGLAVAALLLLIDPNSANAQQPMPQAVPGPSPVHYSYGTLFGTGIYALDDRTVAIFRAPISWTFREPTQDRFGIKLLVPTAIGLHDYDPFDNLIPLDDQFGTLSIVPGVELQYLVGETLARRAVRESRLRHRSFQQ